MGITQAELSSAEFRHNFIRMWGRRNWNTLITDQIPAPVSAKVKAAGRSSYRLGSTDDYHVALMAKAQSGQELSPSERQKLYEIDPGATIKCQRCERRGQIAQYIGRSAQLCHWCYADFEAERGTTKNAAQVRHEAELRRIRDDLSYG